MATLGMIDTYFAIILPYIATPMGLFLMRQFMGQLPDSMAYLWLDGDTKIGFR